MYLGVEYVPSCTWANALVRVMNVWDSFFEGFVQGGQSQLVGDVFAQRPASDNAGEDIEDNGKVDKGAIGW